MDENLELEQRLKEEIEIAKRIMSSGEFWMVSYDFPEQPPEAFYYAYHQLRKLYPEDIARIQYSVIVTSSDSLAYKIGKIVEQLGGAYLVAKGRTIYVKGEYW